MEISENKDLSIHSRYVILNCGLACALDPEIIKLIEREFTEENLDVVQINESDGEGIFIIFLYFYIKFLFKEIIISFMYLPIALIPMHLSIYI